MYLMMGINFMLLNKSLKSTCLGILFTFINIGCGNANTSLFSCPDPFIVDGKSYPLINASLFDGPVENQGELVPRMTKNTREWNIDPRMDPYLVCHFNKVKNTVVLHVAGTTQCTVNENPFTVQCH
ncbi:STY0301 family protein [Serratia sp. DD3]|uniref:STY0301 family protein n=1 Tax=Serratia sp. DD3 TaxID=1410619 RepID=UPI0004D7EC6C|nr:hypothetical protein SRDD_20780 [Serratia sp. DD3]